MGMYDNLTVAALCGTQFQTKSFECYMDHYAIDVEGRLHMIASQTREVAVGRLYHTGMIYFYCLVGPIGRIVNYRAYVERGQTRFIEKQLQHGTWKKLKKFKQDDMPRLLFGDGR